MFTDRRSASLLIRRTRQHWPPDRPFKILSLDGGGIRGIYTARLLYRCETELCSGKSISRYFDLIAGTSTGGIIALGLGLGFSARDLLNFYVLDGRKIFPPLPKTWFGSALRLVSSLLGTRLNHIALERALKERFGENLFGNSSARLVIPAFMVPKTEIAVFKTDHHPDFKNDHKTPAWRIARSTSAAPTYLKGHEHEETGRIFIDGGVWANNPVMIALIDALSAYEISREQISVLSLGTGNPPFHLSRSSAFGGLFSWREIIRAAMFLTTDNATAQAKLLLGPERCTRIEPDERAGHIELDDYDRAAAVLPQIADADFEENRSEIEKFFLTEVQPRERHYTA